MASPVDFTPEAIKDLSDIARHTSSKWGKEQALRYAELLKERFTEISEGSVFSKSIFPATYPAVLFCRCEHHCIFFMPPQVKNKKPVILAVLHERMDLLARLSERLK